MVLTCVTSRYLPNLRYIARLCEVDQVVLLDLAPVPHQNKLSFLSRNKLCDHAGNVFWLSVPVKRSGVESVKDAKIDLTNHNWINKHIKSISNTYPNHKNVAGDFLEELEFVLKDSSGGLLEINERSLNVILKVLHLNNLNIENESSIFHSHVKQHRINSMLHFNASEYLAGQIEWNVMTKSDDIKEISKLGLVVKRSPDLNELDFSPILIKELSCIHAICTYGPQMTREIIDNMVNALKSP